jgi:hypothetical protein
MARGAVRSLGQHRSNPIEVVEHLPRALQKNFTGGRWTDKFVGALQQLHAQTAFQHTDLLTHRGLSQAEFPGRAGETPHLGDRPQRSEQTNIQFHRLHKSSRLHRTITPPPTPVLIKT